MSAILTVFVLLTTVFYRKTMNVLAGGHQSTLKKKAYMSEMLTVFMLLTTENKLSVCLAYFYYLKGNKLRALHIHGFWILRFALITFDSRILL